MEPMSGIEPESHAYQAWALPLSYIDKNSKQRSVQPSYSRANFNRWPDSAASAI